MENKKKFTCPEASIIEFIDEDIIVTSGGTGEGWGDDPRDEFQD